MNWRKPVIEALLRVTGSSIPKYLEEIRRYDALPVDQLQKIQKNKLQSLLESAYRTVPYYRILLHRVNAVDTNGNVLLSNFTKIPPLTKDRIRKLGELLYSQNHTTRQNYFNTSGGSTGEPIKILQDQQYKEWNIANKLFYAEKVGKQLGEKEIKFWGSEKDILDGSIGLKEQLYNWLYNRKLLNAFLMTEDDMFEYVREWNEFKPKHIWVYVDSIFQFARFIKKHNLTIHSPSSVVVTAGVLTEEVRTFVQDTLHTTVYNQYGSREVGDMAAERPDNDGLFSFMWSHYLEVVDGELLVTCLTNYSMPLIRYKIGDTVNFADREERVLKNITGRVTDHFKRKDGTVVHGEYFTHVFYFKPWVKRFKVVQEEYDRIVCQVELASEPKTQDIDKIIADMKVVMGKSCEIVFEYVEEIKPSLSGKYLYTESRLR